MVPRFHFWFLPVVARGAHVPAEENRDTSRALPYPGTRYLALNPYGACRKTRAWGCFLSRYLAESPSLGVMEQKPRHQLRSPPILRSCMSIC